MTHLTEERLMIRDQAREFATERVLPLANKLDPVKGEIPMALREEMAELGYFGILIPEKYGGLGLGVFEYCLVTEELARAWMSVASIIARANTIPGIATMSEEQKDYWLPKAVCGEWLGALAMSEPGAGSDISGIKTRAERDGDSWLITGNKYWCTFADGADYLVVIARTSPPESAMRGHTGLSAFLVEKPRGSLPKGVSGAPIPKIGYFGWNTFELSFDHVRVPADAMLGREGSGFKLATATLEPARAHTAARSIGCARGALEDSIAYANERHQFGGPISNLQAIRFKIAQMATDIEAARQLNYFVCDKLDQGVRCDLESSMSKYFAAEMAERVTSEGLQIHGGAGYTTLHAVERYWRDARLTKIFEGTSEIQQRIISDRLLGKVAGGTAA
ncbi:MAG: acyl-CoA dehydrogenase family protein [Steroidobacteraceae bacterium]